MSLSIQCLLSLLLQTVGGLLKYLDDDLVVLNTSVIKSVFKRWQRIVMFLTVAYLRIHDRSLATSVNLGALWLRQKLPTQLNLSIIPVTFPWQKQTAVTVFFIFFGWDAFIIYNLGGKKDLDPALRWRCSLNLWFLCHFRTAWIIFIIIYLFFSRILQCIWEIVLENFHNAIKARAMVRCSVGWLNMPTTSAGWRGN